MMESLLDTLNDETSVIQFVDELLRLTSIAVYTKVEPEVLLTDASF